MVHSKKANHLARMQRFLKGHPKYAQLMRHLKELPRHLLPEGKFLSMPSAPRLNNTVARHFRRHVSLPLKNWSSTSKHIDSLSKQLNGRIRLLKGVSRYTTWYVPATLGVISVANASPEMRVRTLFEEGFGVVGGAFGTMLGSTVAAGALGLLAFCGLCIGPFGLFVAIFVCASAGGIFGMEAFKKFGGKLYDYSELQSNTKQIYHSPEQFFLEAVK